MHTCVEHSSPSWCFLWTWEGWVTFGCDSGWVGLATVNKLTGRAGLFCRSVTGRKEKESTLESSLGDTPGREAPCPGLACWEAGVQQPQLLDEALSDVGAAGDQQQGGPQS